MSHIWILFTCVLCVMKNYLYAICLNCLLQWTKCHIILLYKDVRMIWRKSKNLDLFYQIALRDKVLFCIRRSCEPKHDAKFKYDSDWVFLLFNRVETNYKKNWAYGMLCFIRLKCLLFWSSAYTTVDIGIIPYFFFSIKIRLPFTYDTILYECSIINIVHWKSIVICARNTSRRWW